MDQLDLRHHGISRPRVLRNSSPTTLYEAALEREPDTRISAGGALITRSGARTGRSPRDKRVVDHPDVRDEVWWGDVNIGLKPQAFDQLYQYACEYLDGLDQIHVVDGFAGSGAQHRVRIRVICERPYHALFMHNMLVRPDPSELADFGEPDYVIINAGACAAPEGIEGIDSPTSVSLCLKRGLFVIMGTEYAGEMKKGVFTIINYLMPKKNVLPMHCSATQGERGDVSLMFGLSGTGKTTLSADPQRQLIGDDEHCWTDNGIFNVEGGCYAKVIDLSPQAEPAIYSAIRFGAVLENVGYDPETHEIDFSDRSLTENTRCAYPVDFIPNARVPGTARTPDNLIFLTCDAFSILPPVSRLTTTQAMYHFISGYTAKVAGTEVGVTEPQATFSPCFGAPFLVHHPTIYARMLAERIRRHNTKVWLVNTGWTGGPYGTGRRIQLTHTRAIIDAIHSGILERTRMITDPVFNLGVPLYCPGVPFDILLPARTWEDKDAFRSMAADLAKRFHENFAPYASQAGREVLGAAPVIPNVHSLKASMEVSQATSAA